MNARHYPPSDADDFDAALLRETTVQTAAIRSAALAGDLPTLSGLAESLALRLSQSGITEQLVRTALSCGVHTTGQVLLDMVGKCIAADAENAALKELERRGLEVTSKDCEVRAQMRVRREVAAAYGGFGRAA
jgi:hypothetical protein